MDEDIKEKLLSLSIFNELKEKISKLEKELEIAKYSAKLNNQRKCWLDDQSCPFGNPDGKFQLRPVHFCCQGGCHKVSDFNKDFQDLLYGDEVPITVSEWCSGNNSLTLSGELNELIECRKDELDEKGDKKYELDEDERILMRAVIKILENSNNLNSRIYYAETLEESA